MLALVGLYLALGGLALLRRRTRQYNPAEWVLFLFAAGLFALLASATKSSDRYLLPLYAFIPVMAVLGADDLRRLLAEHLPDTRPGLRRAVHWGVPVLLLALLLPAQVRATRTESAKFANHEALYRLFDFIRHTLPPDAHILYTNWTGLIDPAYPQQYPQDTPVLAQKVRFSKRLCDFPSLDALRVAGFTHVVITDKELKRGIATKEPWGPVYLAVKRGGTVLFTIRPKGKKTHFTKAVHLIALPVEKKTHEKKK
jgi:hypothetical protein